MGCVGNVRAGGHSPADAAERVVAYVDRRRKAAAFFGNQKRAAHGPRDDRRGAGPKARCVPATGRAEHGASFVSFARREMGIDCLNGFAGIHWQMPAPPFEGTAPEQAIGPEGASCTTAAWSPDGKWMYMSTNKGGRFHIWRERFPKGEPEQITSGPTEEEGIAMEKDGRSFLTSVGAQDSSIWI